MFDFFKSKKKLQEFVKVNIDDILLTNDKNEPMMQMIYCALIQIRYNNNFQQHMDEINELVQIIGEYNGVAWCIMNSLVFATFGSYDSSFSRENLISVLNSIVNSNIKIVGKSIEGVMTTLGENNRFSYGPVIPNFNEMVDSLASVKYGALIIL